MYPTVEGVKDANGIKEKKRLGTLWYGNIILERSFKILNSPLEPIRCFLI